MKKRTAQLLTWSALPAGLLLSGALVLGASHAAFNAQTSTDGNRWSTTSAVTLTSDHEGSAVFDAKEIAPGARGSQSVTVTYDGTPAGVVKAFVASPVGADTALARALMLTITPEGGAPVTRSLHDLASSATGFASGVLPWNVTSGAERTYTIDWSLPASAGNEVADHSVGLTFTWEFQQTVAP
ncbi:hypothetical protein GCM10010329_38890 [Streptomyces spiroverticillatus]|uniref:Uncharacterized protein n=1 Tax=Streptomyces finlayi TaxID=67296 RepID=A0A919CA93_9ACTN|nr:hypothetical protein [Streptomyces finlayi]GHA12112.1 hypothetical protein GCM10010329_38890 [Streptomyces spiroverticillatus]GHC94585.1 hypothetical protein GCM10010334_32730 [Streptomyces finlayi]